MDNNPLNTNSDQPQQPDPQSLNPQLPSQPQPRPGIDQPSQPNYSAPQQSHNYNPQQQVASDQPPQHQQQAFQQPQAEAHQKDTIGIISIVMAFIFPIIGLILGLVGKSNAKKEGRSGKLSSIGAVISGTFIIITVLGFIAIFALTAANQDNVRAKANDTVAKSNVNFAFQKLEESFNANGSYPSVISVNTVSGLDQSTVDVVTSNANYQYVPEDCTGTECRSYVLSYDLESDDNSQPDLYIKESLNK